MLSFWSKYFNVLCSQEAIRTYLESSAGLDLERSKGFIFSFKLFCKLQSAFVHVLALVVIAEPVQLRTSRTFIFFIIEFQSGKHVSGAGLQGGEEM
ncbi:hypothetical protein R1flu_016045 [Riccia fluitans]|uniref:Uncharacterized protein n=1 Tax=Riccia fluitans TaxID=41844 RepID=A0ABD1YNU4_9MARC